MVFRVIVNWHALQKEFKIKDKFRLDILDQAVRNKTIRMWRKDFDISEIVEQATTLHGEKVKRAIERKLGSAASLEAVVFVGGGAAMFPNLAAMFPNGEVAEDPEFSNAKGLLKFSRLQES